MSAQIADNHQRRKRTRTDLQPPVINRDNNAPLVGTRSSMVIPRLFGVIHNAILLPTFRSDVSSIHSHACTCVYVHVCVYRHISVSLCVADQRTHL